MSNILGRVRSIDAFRALTVFLMIFVNDLEDVPNTPVWINHVPDEGFGLGMADTIFPAFLFIVGLSIPFAFQNRMQRGDTKIPWRIITRSFALILIGFFQSNMQSYDKAHTLFSEAWWEILVTISFFFIFLDYHKETSILKQRLMRGFGIILLITMAALYRSNDPVHPWLHFTWWEILGLIGWAYLLCGLIYYYSAGRLWVQAAFWLFFVLFNIDTHYGFFDFLNPLKDYVWIAGNGAMQAFTMAGIFVAVLYMRLSATKDIKLLLISLFIIAVVLFNFGFVVNGGISKSRDTPGWVLICTAISMVVYAFFIFLVDIKGKLNWFKIIEPAGKYAFTCYLVPSIFYCVYELSKVQYPAYLNSGIPGVFRCLAFALIMVWITALLVRANIKLKI